MTDNIQDEIEDKVIDYINSAVAGRLIIFKPEKSNFGADLGVGRRGKYKEKQIYLQINSVIIPAKQDSFIKDFPRENFKTDKNFYLIFAYFNDLTQKISDYIWLVPSLDFRDIAQEIKSIDGKNFFRFEASSDLKSKNQYSKFLVNIKDLGKLILDALENNGKFTFKGTEFDEKEKINLESLKEFLCEARKNTYATGVASSDNPRLLASTQLEFQKGTYFYRDVFFNGDKNFIGQEIIYQDSKPIWGMNYIGNQIGRLETVFLKESLFKLAEKCRLGGVCEYEKRELKYQDHGQGTLEDFFGKEEISLENKNIYKLEYRGGTIS